MKNNATEMKKFYDQAFVLFKEVEDSFRKEKKTKSSIDMADGRRYLRVFTPQSGRKKAKAYAFIDKQTGVIHKATTWYLPNKEKTFGNIFKEDGLAGLKTAVGIH